ncbi:molybdenum ABC transporter, periplasmic molybdate-binding protein [Methanocaldococcus villosus KIN24-T80]|uniref:Molybdenum ABC transporter, periplasmic molybdate-binding protein n=1 Tax=Methanocaldococcus villosus KIN24-T80 TaxID=1069083 RepID=N6UWL1_9EURY|nr:molybdate ABC transporter substrate-binding protein [Methanocaldococcus villosus]ENN96719.1 molybdenum ABC transporter, periplasmic molybdate-binding protein [Methanocaldococcus villosus KIN24-T80]
MKKFTILILTVGFLLITLCGCTEKTHDSQNSAKIYEGHSIIVLCGAGLIKPMEELKRNFENKTGAKVNVHYGGSAELFGILKTTGGDVFIPGAYKYTKDAMDIGLILNDTVKNITYHIPVIIVPKGNPKNIKDLNDLTKPGVRIAIGDPKSSAIGKVSVKIFEKNKIWEKVKPNIVVYAPTVNQLLIYVATKQVDAAIIWEDMTTWSQAKGKIEVIEIPKDKNIIKTIPTAVTTKAKDLEVAKAFNNYISSDEAKTIWEKWGFKPCR